MSNNSKSQPKRHILSLSGGKDSTALAVYLRNKIPGIEYAFCDTGEELPETEEFLNKLEVFLGKPITRLNPDRPFMHYLQIYNGVLPDARTRWCTRKLKIEPFEKFVGNDICYSYIGIRADESHRKGYISTKPNIIPQYPFIEDGITRNDVFRILEENGLGMPKYYDWRSRSGCYFCFFQQRIEWVGLLYNHPKLFDKASDYEKINHETGEGYTWSSRESLKELSNPERIDAIKREHELRKQRFEGKLKPNQTLINLFAGEDDGDDACLICHL